MQNLLSGTKIIHLKVAVAAGTSDVTDASIVDTAGYEGVMFIAVFGTSAVDNGIKSVKQDTDSALGAAQDLEGSKVLLDATSKVAVCDVYRPRERYLRPIAVRGTSTTLDSLIAILYGPIKQPVTQGTTTTAEKFVSPAEGTA